MRVLAHQDAIPASDLYPESRNDNQVYEQSLAQVEEPIFHANGNTEFVREIYIK